MQPVPPALLEVLRKELSGSFLTADFVLDPAQAPPFAGYAPAVERLQVDVRGGVVARRWVFSSEVAGGPAFELEVALSVQGPQAALHGLEIYLGGFQRAIPYERITLLHSDGISIGDAGVGWSWSNTEDYEVAAIIRHNVLVTASGPGSVLLSEILGHVDRKLEALDHVSENPYFDHGLGFSESELVGRVGVGRTLDLPVPDDRESFFSAPTGSVNRAPESPGNVYYRAGLEPDVDVIVESLSVGPGVVPKGRRIPIRVHS